MNKTELQAIRRHLFFSVAEASRLISHTSERAWRNWEHGIAPVPDDVAENLTDLCEWRSEMLDNMERFLVGALKRNKYVGTAILWYGCAEDWWSSGSDRPSELWRPHCSVVAELAANHDVTLIVFDATQYDSWLRDQTGDDSETMRGQWAGTQIND